MTAHPPVDSPATMPSESHTARWARLPAWFARGREALAAGALFLIAAALRLGLAAHGWPYLNSDEAVMGLMGVDIWRRGARPIFTYSQDYIGALQAYLSAPLFALLNGDPLALRLATLIQTMLFLAVMYALARRLYAPGVALLTLALLALGPEYALKHELQAGAGAQDTLLFGALVVWLATIRLRGGWNLGARLALDTGIGLAIGLGLWGDFLFLPYRRRRRACPGLHRAPCAGRRLAGRQTAPRDVPAHDGRGYRDRRGAARRRAAAGREHRQRRRDIPPCN